MTLAIRYLGGGASSITRGQDVLVVASRVLETGTQRLPVESGPDGSDRVTWRAGRVLLERGGGGTDSFRIGERFTLGGGQLFRVVDV